ncbi:MAG: amino acid permease [Phycisphaerales bacterium JB061]
MLVTESRPRNLKWFHAGPLLYGDWGTSRLYVLGLAFLYTAHASVLYLAAIGLLMIAVSWAYTIVCKAFPDGGGVYTAARQLSPTLSVIGSTLLLSGYIMTAAISVVEAFHYFGTPHWLTVPLSLVTLAFVGLINWFGARAAGRFALIVAFVALGVCAVMAVLSIPFFVKGLGTIEFSFIRESSPSEIWIAFTGICLALAGVEAVANMTGLMNHPVEKTAKKTIWPVTIEVVALNMFFGLALAGLSYTVDGRSLADTHEPHVHQLEHYEARVESGEIPQAKLDQVEKEVEKYTNASMRVIASESGEKMFGEHAGVVAGNVAGIAFGLLLLSATNTAIMAMVSVLFAMAQDKELPHKLTKLNYSGVPWVGLIVSLVIPAGVLIIEQDVTVLAKLYVLGVCGAITVTMSSVALNKELKISKLSRTGIAAIAVFLLAVSVTIGVTQWVSTAFSGGLIAVALGSRWVLSKQKARVVEPLAAPETGWLSELEKPTIQIDASKPAIMLAARGRNQSEFAVDLAKRRGATLYAIYVRSLRVMDITPGRVPNVAEDPQAQEALGTTAVLAREAGVPFVPIYVTSPEITEEILDYTVTHGCDTLIMGKTQRSFFARKLDVDVVSRVASMLPDSVALITRSATTPHVAGKA